MKCDAAGFLQLAGGTNAHTVEGLRRERLFQTTTISGTKLLATRFSLEQTGLLFNFYGL